MNEDEARRQAACAGKEGFTSPRLAQRVASRPRGLGKARREREAYRCPFCGLWHVGTPFGVRRWGR